MTLKDELTATFDGLLDWHQERSILEVTELLCDIMKKHGVARLDLAKRIGKSKGFISQLLDGTANMTIRTMSDMFVALGYEFHPVATALDKKAETVIELGVSHLSWGSADTAITPASNYIVSNGSVFLDNMATPAA